LTERGLRVPQDVAVVGFDDIEDGRFSGVWLTTISPDKQAIARLAVDALAQRPAPSPSAPPTPEPRRTRPGFRLVVRESTARRTP
jgi:DNA-binding LacI/PurR family transcriptional regulator